MTATRPDRRYWLLTLDRNTGRCWSYGPYPEDEAWRYMQMRRDKRFYATVVMER